MTYTVAFIHGKNKWVVKNGKGVWLSEHDTEDEAKDAVKDLKDKENQVSFDL